MIYPQQLIKANPTFKKVATLPLLEVSEFFFDTIQGENNIGYPATFIRLQHCTLNCVWCDSKEVWRFGNPYSFDELFKLMEKFDVIRKFKEGQHLVLTGGSPLKQQFQLIGFIRKFITIYGFKPYIEIENECTIMPSNGIIPYIDCWNNSPKLENSTNSRLSRFKPEILSILSLLPNSYFKFVLTGESDWKEIEENYIQTHYISKRQIVLMAEGDSKVKLEKNRDFTLEIAIRENVRYTTREHIMIWDKKTGV